MEFVKVLMFFADRLVCFEKSNNLYEYYEATKYNTRYLVPLRNQLLTHLTTLQGLKDLSGFQSFIDQKLFGKKFLLTLVQGDKNWTDHWSVYHENLVKINREIINLVDFCIDEDRILWRNRPAIPQLETDPPPHGLLPGPGCRGSHDHAP